MSHGEAANVHKERKLGNGLFLHLRSPQTVIERPFLLEIVAFVRHHLGRFGCALLFRQRRNASARRFETNVFPRSVAQWRVQRF